LKVDDILNQLLPAPDFKDSDRQLAAKKIHYQALIDLTKATYESSLRSQENQEVEQFKADLMEDATTWANEYALGQAIHNAYIEVAKSQISERMKRAEFVQKTAAAISAAYVAILGLTYSVEGKVLLPPRGFVPALFLGVAIFLSAVYAAYLTDSGKMESTSKTHAVGDLGALQPARLNTFILWTITPLLKRKFMLQASVASLGFSAIFLPLPYLAIPDWTGLVAAGIGLVGTFAIPALLDRTGSETD
jgi:predicted XRE-type DNA-binding protein